MATAPVIAESILVIDLGAFVTRAILFDVVDGQYRYLGEGSAATTASGTNRDIGAGLLQAVSDLEGKIGRTMIDRGFVILPSREDSTGVDRLALVHSAGWDLHIVTVGLMGDGSLQSANNLAATIPGRVIESIGFGDPRRFETQLDAIISGEPDLVILAGGSDNGASRSVARQAELILTVCRILPQEKRPYVLYAGNHALARKIQDVFSKFTVVATAPNVRMENGGENLTPAQVALASLMSGLRTRQMSGLDFLSSMCSVSPLPASHAAGRIIQFLSRTNDLSKGALGARLAGEGLLLAAAQRGRLRLDVTPFMPDIGKKETAGADEERISRWLSMEIPEEDLRDYIQQKALYPESIPMCGEALDIEQAIARSVLEFGMKRLRRKSPEFSGEFEPILAGGSFFSLLPTDAQRLLLVLDGLQPRGISTIIYDTNDLLPALGAAAEIKSVLPVQALESSAFRNLGTVICTESPARGGTPVLNVRLELENESEMRTVIRQGSLTVLPLKNGQKAVIHLEPLRQTRIEPGSDGGVSSFKIIGGSCGAVIDTRGRPIELPADPTQRRERLKNWRKALDE